MLRLMLLCGLVALFAASSASAATIADQTSVSGTKQYVRTVQNAGGTFSVTVAYTVKWASKTVILQVRDGAGDTLCGVGSDATGAPLSCTLTDASAGAYTVAVSTLNGKPVPITVTITGDGIS